MKIIIHCGLHKTGTSSLQSTLKDAFGNPQKGLPFFPQSSILGPGHTLLIDQLRKNLNIELLDKWTDQAINESVDALILSSEDIFTLDDESHQFLFNYIEKNFNDIKTVITLTPYVKRFRSAYIEAIKNGDQIKFESSLEYVLAIPTMNNIIVENFVKKLNNYDNKIIISDGYDPNITKKFLGFFSEINFPIESSLFNKSFDEFDTEFWLLMNRYRQDLDGPTYHIAQKAIEGVLESSSWIDLRKHIPKKNYLYPPEWREILNEQAFNQYQIFFSRRNKFEVIGELSVIKNLCNDCYKFTG